MRKITFPITLTLDLHGIPKRCRRARTYVGLETYLFEITQLEEMPPVVMTVENFEEVPEEYYHVEDKLYKTEETTFTELKEKMHNRGHRYPKLHPFPEEDCTLVGSNYREQIGRIIDWIHPHLLLPDGETLLVETVEPAYQVRRTLNGDYLTINYHPEWGQDDLFRADQYETVLTTMRENTEDWGKKQSIVVFDTSILKGKINPNSPKLNPEGDTAQANFEILQTIVDFEKCFSEDKSSITDTLIPPIHTEGIWKMGLLNQHSHEIKVVLLECDPQSKEVIPGGKYQTIGDFQTRYTFTSKWKSRLAALRTLIKSSRSDEAEFTWEESWKENEKIQLENTIGQEKEQKILDVLERRHASTKPTSVPNANCREEMEFAS